MTTEEYNDLWLEIQNATSDLNICAEDQDVVGMYNIMDNLEYCRKQIQSYHFEKAVNQINQSIFNEKQKR